MKQIHSTYLVILLVLLNCTLFSCTDDNGLKPVKLPDNIDGYVQKGPFSTGSQITIQELDDKLSPNGKIFQTSTNDDFGSFELNTEFTSKYIEVIASGFYFNEVNGSLSPANLSLRAITDITTDTVVNVNILTTLEAKRIVYLINEKGKSFSEAKQQAETEVLGLFHIETEDPTDFVQMDISKEGEANAILLAVSAILQGQLSVGDLSELINKISLDIEQDGTIDNADHTNVIRQNSIDLNMEEVRLNLANRYNSLGLTVSIPVFEDYIDSDGDSLLNKFDTRIVFNNIERAKPDSVYVSNNIAIKLPRDSTSCLASIDKGSLIINNIQTDRTTYRVFHGDSLAIKLNNSTNYLDTTIATLMITNNTGTFEIYNKHPLGGVIKQITANADWSARSYPSCIVYDNKMWLMGGRGDITHNDVWCSTDGCNWTLVTDSAAWCPRVNACCLVFNNKMWLMGGQNDEKKINDVWNSSDGKNWTLVTDSAAWNPFRIDFRPCGFAYKNKIWYVGVNKEIETQYTLFSSTDGINWDTEMDLSSIDIFGISSDKSIVLLLGHLITWSSYSSSNGIEWNTFSFKTESPVLFSRSARLVYYENHFIIFDNKCILYSKDGLSYNQFIGFSRELRDLIYNHREGSVITFNKRLWFIGGKGNDVWCIE